MPSQAPETSPWLGRDAAGESFQQRLALAAEGGGPVVFDHVAEAATAWLIGLAWGFAGYYGHLVAVPPASPRFCFGDPVLRESFVGFRCERAAACGATAQRAGSCNLLTV